MNFVPIYHFFASRLRLYLVCVVVLLIANQAIAQNPYDKEQRRLANVASKLGKSPRGMIPLLELWRNWNRASVGVTTQLLEKLARDKRLPVHRRVFVQSLLAISRTRTGDIQAAIQTFDELGYVSKWRVIGPFDNEGKTGFDISTPLESKPEQAPDMTASYQGQERQVKWRKYPDIVRYGYLSLDSVFRPNDNVCGFAETTVYSDRARPLTLWIGAGGAIKAYWNGQPVFRDETYRSSPFRDRHVVALKARAGNNRLLIKSCISNNRWGFFVRIGDQQGGVAKGLTFDVESNPPPAIAEEKKTAIPKSKLPSVPLVAFEKLIEKQPNNASLQEDLARYLSYTGSDDPKERRAKQLAYQACKIEPSLARIKLAAILAEERGEVMRFAAQAKALWPKATESLLLQAAVIRDGPIPEEALPLLDKIPNESLFGAGAMIMRASILRDIELNETAYRMLQSFVKKHSPTVLLLQMLSSLAASTGRVGEEIEYQKQLLQMRFDQIRTHRFLIDDALERGKFKAVFNRIDSLRRLFPGNVSNLRFIARMFIAVGRPDMALDIYREAIELAPEDAVSLVVYGRALLRAGYEKGAVESFRKALAIRPQDAETRELIEQLEQRELEQRFDEAYAVSAQKLLQKRRSKNDYQAIILQNLRVNTVFENGLGSSFTQLIVQVNNSEGARNWQSHSIQYDPGSQRVDLRLARVYRAKDGEISDYFRTYEQQIGQPWYRLYYDTRALTVVFPDLEPGDTLELRYRIDDIAHRNLYADYYGDLYTLQDFVPVERVKYILITPASRQFFFNKPSLSNLKHTQHKKGNKRIDQFVAHNLPAIHAESDMPGMTEISPYIHVSTYRSWEQVGHWYWGLIKDQLYADKSLKRTVASLVEGTTDTRTKVQRIYRWVVEQTRYVGLEFGIHGFLPYRVPLVVQRGFGDCKDKAALMYTMFKEAGIDSRIVLARTRSNGAVDKTPASLAVFDHAIIYVPEIDLYLDGTAEQSGTTELPPGDQGIMVLRVAEGVAELGVTPVFDSKRNFRDTKLQVALSQDGSARVEGEEVVVGSEAAQYRNYYQAMGTRTDRFERSLALRYPGVELDSLKFESLEELEDPIRYSYRATVPQMAHWNQNVMRTPLTVLKDLLRSMARSPSRKYPLDLGGTRSYLEQRTINIPPGFQIVELPEGGEAKSEFGRLRLETKVKGKQVVTNTAFDVNRDRVTPEQYPAFRSWVEKADLLLRQRLDIRRNANE